MTRPEPPARTLDCPICGRELGVEPREHGAPWTRRQTWLVMRLADLGAGRKFIARCLGEQSPAAVYEHIYTQRGAS